jgi:hypothetical protein
MEVAGSAMQPLQLPDQGNQVDLDDLCRACVLQRSPRVRTNLLARS